MFELCELDFVEHSDFLEEFTMNIMNRNVKQILQNNRVSLRKDRVRNKTNLIQ